MNIFWSFEPDLGANDSKEEFFLPYRLVQQGVINSWLTWFKELNMATEKGTEAIGLTEQKLTEPCTSQGVENTDVKNKTFDDCGSTKSKKELNLRNRKKSAKIRLTKARNRLNELLAQEVIAGKPGKSDIKRALCKVQEEFSIIEKIISKLREIIAFGEEGDEDVDVDGALEILDKEIEELSLFVEKSVKESSEYMQKRLETGEKESELCSLVSTEDGPSSIMSVKSATSVTSTIASQRKREAAEANQRLIELEKEQQLAEEELHRQTVALELSKRRTEEGGKIAALNRARAEKAERLAAKTENIAINTPGEDIMSYNRSPESNELLIGPPSQTPLNPV